MRNLRALVQTFAFLAMGFSATLGCDSVDAAFDCAAVCDRYKECYNQSYDTAGCRTRCRADSANDSTVRSKADACEACIGRMSCLSATFNCAQDCGAIVP